MAAGDVGGGCVLNCADSIIFSNGGGAGARGDCAARPRTFVPPAAHFHSAASNRELFIQKLPHSVSRRRRNVGRLRATGALSNFGPLDKPILRARTGARAKSSKTKRNQASSLAGARGDLGTSICRNRLPQLCIRCQTGRIAHLSPGLEACYDLPRRGIPSCRRSRRRRRRLLRPRSICALDHAGSEAPIALFRNLDRSFRPSPNFKRSPHRRALQQVY